MDIPENSLFSGSISDLLSVLSILMKSLSHASAKKKTKRLKGLELCTFNGGSQVASWH